MTELRETSPGDASRIFSEQEVHNLHINVIDALLIEKPEIMDEHEAEIYTLIGNGVGMLQAFEKATHQTHPRIHTDTDIVYVDTGPGPYSKRMLEPGKTDLDDVAYQKLPWTRRMDRARIRAAYTIATDITSRRIEKKTGVRKPAEDLTQEDFEQYGPYLMYASVNWQVSHIKHVMSVLRKTKVKRRDDTESDKNVFRYPDSKIISYQDFTTREGEQKPIEHTEDQMEGLHFPPFENGNPPRRIAMVSHAAHLVRVMHILGKYPDSIPPQTVLQLFPIPTPKLGVKDYAKAELIGTVATIYERKRASLTPYANYEI